jgi:uncharacterized flavoprotein (TIGR03862 family)
MTTRTIAVIGGGPAGLIAAEAALAEDCSVDIYDSMPSLGRKFLMAGKGGLNLTHAEPLDPFLARYGARRSALETIVRSFDPSALRHWAQRLGVDTFVGTSGRVFPGDFKAAPLLRAWLHRLREAGARIHVRHRWKGWTGNGALLFETPQGERHAQPNATVLALGGGSWRRLGSDAAWVPILQERGVAIAPLRPANCGFDVEWSAHFHSRFAGQPVKSVTASCVDASGQTVRQQGEFVITSTGIEGGLVYALSAPLRDEIAARGSASVLLDLAPGRERTRLARDLSRPRGSESFSNFLRKTTGLEGVKAALLRECLGPAVGANIERLADAIKSLPLRLVATRPLDEAISTAGGVSFEELDEHLMLRKLPGVYCAGEMLDWEAPTGGYLLTACFASGKAAGLGASRWAASDQSPCGAQEV